MHSSQPNVILIMTDQQSATTLPSYGNTFARTPNIDRLAAQSVQWNWAFVQQPLCVPSRSSILTGRYPEALRSRGNAAFLGDDEMTLPKVLRQAGYKLALTGKNHCVQPDELQTWDYVYEVDHLGPREPKDEARLKHVEEARRKIYHNKAISYGVLPFPKEEFGTFLVRDAAVRFLEQEHNQPFFLWLSFPDPHPPYTIPKEYEGTYSLDAIPLPPRETQDPRRKPARYHFMSRMMEYDAASEKELKEYIATYYTMITMIDDALGDILETLKRRSLDENTLVIFVSDHGDFAGHHNMIEKGPCLYDSLVRVPLMFRWPGRLTPRVIRDTMIECVDIAPSVLDLLAIDPPQWIQGKSAVPVMAGESAFHRDAVYASAGRPGKAIAWDEIDTVVSRRMDEYHRDPNCRIFKWITPEREGGRMCMVRTLEWKYVYHTSGEDELYDLRNDPDELINLCHDRAYRHIVDELRGRLIASLLDVQDPRPPAGFDPTLYTSGRVRP